MGMRHDNMVSWPRFEKSHTCKGTYRWLGLLYHQPATLLAYLGLVGVCDMHLSSSTSAIILAAGSSSRIGADRHKLLLPLAGRPVLGHVIEATLASQARLI